MRRQYSYKVTTSYIFGESSKRVNVVRVRASSEERAAKAASDKLHTEYAGYGVDIDSQKVELA